MPRKRAKDRFIHSASSNLCLVPASVYDPLSARMAEDLGFEAAILGGSSASLAILGAPDEILITATELADLVRRICAASPVPLIVDADHGYGNALNTARTVALLAGAGAAAVTIEDTELPTGFGAGGGPRLVSREEGLWRVHAAVEAAREHQTAVIGRTSAAILTNQDDMIARLSAYEEAGVDVLFPAGLTSMADLSALAQKTSLPIMLSSVPAEAQSMSRLVDLRVRIVLSGHAPIRASIQAAYETLRAVREDRPVEAHALASKALMDRLTRHEELKRVLQGDRTKPRTGDG